MEIGKTCPKCGTFFTENTCPNCGWGVLPLLPKSVKQKVKGISR